MSPAPARSLVLAPPVLLSSGLYTLIPTYTFDGARLRDYSAQSIEWLEEMGSVMVRRKRGRIVSARFRPVAARRPTPSRGTGLACVTFTEREQIGRGRLIVHKPLPYAAVDHETGRVESRQALESLVRRRFLAVLESVLRA